MVWRIMRRAPLRMGRLAWGFASGGHTRKPAIAKGLFFSDDIPAADLDRCEPSAGAAALVTHPCSVPNSAKLLIMCCSPDITSLSCSDVRFVTLLAQHASPVAFIDGGRVPEQVCHRDHCRQTWL